MTPPITIITESISHFEFEPIGYFIEEYVKKDTDFGILGKFTNVEGEKYYEFLDKLHSLHSNIYHSVKNKFAINEGMSMKEFMDKYYDDFLDYLNSIKISLNEISNIIEQIDFEYDEYYNFISIHKMISYIVGDIEKYFKYSSFILLILTEFKDLMDKKRIMRNYKKEYEKFDDFLYEQEDYFYTEIFDRDSKYDDVIDKVTNILG